MDGAAAAPRPTTKFNRTCSLLRQFIKERGTLGMDIQMKATPPTGTTARSKDNAPPVSLPDLNGTTTVSGSPRPAQPRQQVLSSSATAVPQASSQLTVFYGGKVFVFDNFPQGKARELMAVAAAARYIPPPSSGNSSIHHNPTCAAPRCIPSPSSGNSNIRPPHHLPILVSGSDLPIARRVSFNRFLEKRKDRISSKAPYQVAGSPDPMASKPQQSNSSGGSPSEAHPTGDPYSSAEAQAPPPYPHRSSIPDSNQLPSPAVDDDDEEPSSSSVGSWLGLAPPPSKASPPRTAN